ncbi:DMT family transporter [Celeribacter arenosi]|uniref:DMT family transporter n=1 Tax=Celeribacter arenosi TaxID=792649 RepID=A0ABP7K0E9_9RHOB
MAELSDNSRGALLMAGAMAAFTFNDSFMKALLVDIPLSQALLMRGVLNVLMVFVAVAPFVDPVTVTMPRRDWVLIVLRSFMEVGVAFTFLHAITTMPLANATAIMQTMPLVITIASALVFRDPLGWRRILAIIVGFCGVLLIVKPGTDGFSAGALWALAAVVAVTIRDLSVRGMSSAASTSTVTLCAVLAVVVVAGLSTLGEDWVQLSTKNWGQLMGTAICVTVAYVLSVVVMKVGEISFVSPFRYTALIWALLVGFFAFGEWPAISSLVGAAIIAATGIYTVIRETRLRRTGQIGGKAVNRA